MGTVRSYIPWREGKCRLCKQPLERASYFAGYCNSACKMKAYRKRIKAGIHLQPLARRVKAARRRHPRRAKR